MRGDPSAASSSSPVTAGEAASRTARAGRRAPRALPRLAPTRLALFAAALAESSWLAAVLLIPVYFNIHSERIFEEDKVPLLRSLALSTLFALAMYLAERGRTALRVHGLPLWRVPLVAPAAALLAAYVVATLASVNPHISFLGAYFRQQGFYTWLAYPSFFVAIVLLVRERRQIERLLAAMLFAAGVVAFHTLTQQLGYDPLPWGTHFLGRAYGPAGNPIFLGAFLVMVVPLSAVSVLRAARAAPPRVRRPRAAKALSVGVLFVLLSIQLGILVSSQSRGPVVGLGAALLTLGLLYCAVRGWKKLTAGILALALVAALLFAASSFLGGSVRGEAGMARLGHLLDLQRGSGKVRVLIWQAASQAFTADPWRTLIGYGPDTFLSVVNPYYPPELAYHESRLVLPDRAHSAPFDALITTGLFGCAAEVALFIAFLRFGLGGLGLVRGRAQSRTFVLSTAAGALAGAVLPRLADGSWRFTGIGLSLGLFGALVSYVLLRTLSSKGEVRRRRAPESLLLLALLAAAAGHLIETSVGIPTAAPRLYFWVFAGLVVAIGLRFARPGLGRGEGPVPRSMPWGIFVGLVLAVLVYDIYTPALGTNVVPLLLGIFLPAWGLGAFFSVSTSAGWKARRPIGWRFVLSSLLPAASFAALLVWWVQTLPSGGPDPITQALRFVTSLTDVVSLVYVLIFAVVIFAAVGAVEAGGGGRLRLTRRSRLPAVYVALAVCAAFVIATTNVVVSRADIFSKQASYYERKDLLDIAARLYEEALSLRPWTDSYASGVGRVLSKRASEVAPVNPALALDYLARTQSALEHAYRIDPLHLDHSRNLARLHQQWAALVQDPAARAEHFEEADRWFEQTLRVAPTHAAVLDERALMRFQRGDVESALELLGRSLTIDPRYTTTYWVRGNIRANMGDAEGALADYDKALEIDPTLLPALSGKGAVLLRLGRLDEAIIANRRAAKIKGGDFISHSNLAVLYRDQGKLGQSMRHAKRALAVAPRENRAALEQFIADLEAKIEEEGRGSDQ